MPGSLIIESMAQAAGSLVLFSLNKTAKNISVLLMSVNKTKFRKPVIPGDVMVLDISVKRIRNKLWKFGGQVIVDSQRVSECEFSAMMRI